MLLQLPPEATFHCAPIPEGYARVLVDEVVGPYSGLELDTRSSVGSAPGDALLDTYPVDDIIENTNCELHFKIKNISMKVEHDVAFTITPRSNLPLRPDSRGLCSCLG